MIPTSPFYTTPPGVQGGAPVKGHRELLGKWGGGYTGDFICQNSLNCVF